MSRSAHDLGMGAGARPAGTYRPKYAESCDCCGVGLRRLVYGFRDYSGRTWKLGRRCAERVLREVSAGQHLVK